MLQIFLRVAEETGVDADPEENPRQAGTPPSPGPSRAPQGGAADDSETGTHTHTPTHSEKTCLFPLPETFPLTNVLVRPRVLPSPAPGHRVSL